MSVRAVGVGEEITETTPDRLAEHMGRIVQAPGHRGYLRGVWQDSDGLYAVCTNVGIAHYEPTTQFLVWGP